MTGDRARGGRVADTPAVGRRARSTRLARARSASSPSRSRVFARVLLVFGKNPLTGLRRHLREHARQRVRVVRDARQDDPADPHRARRRRPGAHLAHQRRRRGPALHRRARATWVAHHLAGAARAGCSCPSWPRSALVGRRSLGRRRGLLRARGWVERDDLDAAPELRRDPARELPRVRAVEGSGGRQLPADRRVRRPARSFRRSGRRACTSGSSSPSSPWLVFAFVMARTRWGLEMRAIGGNAEAARRNGHPDRPLRRRADVHRRRPRRAWRGWPRSPRSRDGCARACRRATDTPGS